MSLTTLFAVVLLPVLLGLTGLVADGGEILVARREVQGLAKSAAHAGAAQLDTAVTRAGQTSRRRSTRARPSSPRRSTSRSRSQG
jgi:Flp pilus assembly protein TadG